MSGQSPSTTRRFAVAPAADWFAEIAPNAARGWSALVTTCGADAGCAQAFPDLAERLDAFVTDLAAEPRRFDEVQLEGPDRAPFLVTASRLLSYVRFYSRVSEVLGEMPMSIAGPPGGSAGTLQTLDPDDPDTLKFQASDTYSDVPFLVLAGDLDTVSSPEGADAFAEGLSDTQVIHFAGLGTQPPGPPETTAQNCARQLRDAFLAEPTAPVDDACVATSHGTAFSLP